MSFPLENREDMLSSKSNRLTEALEEANQLFSGGNKFCSPYQK